MKNVFIIFTLAFIAIYANNQSAIYIQSFLNKTSIEVALYHTTSLSNETMVNHDFHSTSGKSCFMKESIIYSF
ncbi:MAG: hypothetical protein MK105_04195 [Crocinitomicaceae bacterium]|nr:hypothetical protein [Crocinitomicaceae bacterium]